MIWVYINKSVSAKFRQITLQLLFTAALLMQLSTWCWLMNFIQVSMCIEYNISRNYVYRFGFLPCVIRHWERNRETHYDVQCREQTGLTGFRVSLFSFPDCQVFLWHLTLVPCCIGIRSTATCM